MPSAKQPALCLRVDDLTVMRGGREILAGLSLRLEAGQGLLLTGPNGAGKTTLLRAIAGLLPSDAGRVELEGVIDGDDVGAHCHLIGHQNGVKASQTVAENVGFWSRFLGGSNADAEAALDRFNLGEIADLPAGYLSAGQKRRLGLARLLAAKRPLWLLDEPTVSLDAASTEMLAAVIAQHIADGGLAVAATHIPLGISAMGQLRLGQLMVAQ